MYNNTHSKPIQKYMDYRRKDKSQIEKDNREIYSTYTILNTQSQKCHARTQYASGTPARQKEICQNKKCTTAKIKHARGAWHSVR